MPPAWERPVAERSLAAWTPLLLLRRYGGSVNDGNVDALMACPDIDGALVGGASLKADAFSRIINFK